MFSRAFMLLVVTCIQRTCPHHSGLLEEKLLTEEDQHFCRGGLELSYPGVDIRSCVIIPWEFREKISHEWGPPQVRLDTAKTIGKRSRDAYRKAVL
ncbi:hypothetical protein AMELA_G00285970 [Ameiurus melas]|uniref:Uncharacterized protein n=1 Tax=Ameiurus melas TaxID=219545 RepID=A0A7J5ZJ39_AMEME|nr:hypothetical protein AMELA_G00285970 [Ameiurus melas]